MSRKRGEVLQKLDIIHCLRSLAALEEDSIRRGVPFSGVTLVIDLKGFKLGDAQFGAAARPSFLMCFNVFPLFFSCFSGFPFDFKPFGGVSSSFLVEERLGRSRRWWPPGLEPLLKGKGLWRSFLLPETCHRILFIRVPTPFVKAWSMFSYLLDPGTIAKAFVSLF